MRTIGYDVVLDCVNILMLKKVSSMKNAATKIKNKTNIVCCVIMINYDNNNGCDFSYCVL